VIKGWLPNMLDNEKVLQIVTAELTQNHSSGHAIPDLETSLDYYLGNPNGREVEGRSQVTSTDVADAIEWIMPQIMKSFTQNNEIVTFDPVHQGDELQAELESQYVYEVLMKQNEGFVLIHQFVKDALMQRNGILKVYYENETKSWTSSYTGISQEELNVLGSAPTCEIVELSDYIDSVTQQPLFDVKIKFTSSNGRIIIDAVPPEEFRICSDHNSICLDGARFTAHVLEKTFSELAAEGYDTELLDTVGVSEEYDSDYRFAAQGESTIHDYESDDPSQRKTVVSECYLLMDYNEDGISELCKVTVAGDDSPTVVLSVEEIDSGPWVSTTAIIMSHKWQGLSIYDRLKEIQDQKTALWRSMFDNVYFQNNQRVAVVEGQVNLDDMLVSRPNGIVRVKRLDAIMPIATPQLSSDSYTMMQHLDEVKAGRSGVSAEGGATPQNIGDRVGSQGVDRMMNAKEALVGLIIRVVAETGMKPLCIKIRDLSTKHVDAITDFRHKGEWRKIQPSSWIDRSSTTVRVGTGTGDTSEKTSALMFVMTLQEKLQIMPEQTLVDQSQMYEAIDDYCKLTGLNSAGRYFVDPNSEEGKKAQETKAKSSEEASQKEDQMQQTIAQSQMKLAEAEVAKAQAQMANVQLKSKTDMIKNQLQLQKQTYEAQLKQLEQQLSEAQMVASSIEKADDLQFRYDDMNARNGIELTRIEADKERDLNAQFLQNKESVNEGTE